MHVRIFDPSMDISRLEGFTIVVDVFRAFSTAYFIQACNPDRYIVVDAIDRAFAIKAAIPNSVLIGERDGIIVEGFDFGNSPTEIAGRDFSGKTVIHTTTAGTKGLLRQPRGNEVVVGSFVNSRALVDRIRALGVEVVNIYCTAEKGRLFGEEDYLFADYLANALNGEPNDYAVIRERLKAGSGRGFADDGFAPSTDFGHCMDLDRFDFVLERTIASGAMHETELRPCDRGRIAHGGANAGCAT